MIEVVSRTVLQLLFFVVSPQNFSKQQFLVKERKEHKEFKWQEDYHPDNDKNMVMEKYSGQYEYCGCAVC